MDASWNWTRAGTRLDRAVVQGVVLEFVYGAGRTPQAMVRDGVGYTLHCDQVGSLRVVADESGNVVKEVVYDAFGNILEDTNPAFRIPIGFAGGLHDPDTGFIRFGYRDYDPDTGRFTALDPIGYAGGDPDLYGYCLDDPVNLIDPEGLNPLFRALQFGERAWKYVEPFVETGLPTVRGWADAAIGYGKEYGGEILDAVGKAGKWYIDTVDKNIEKIQQGRFHDRED